MRAKSLLAAAAALALGAVSAEAGYTITVQAIPGTNSAIQQNAGKTLLLFRAQANGTSESILGLDVRLTADTNFVFTPRNLDQDQVGDYDVLFSDSATTFAYDDGTTQSIAGAQVTGGGRINTFVRPGANSGSPRINFTPTLVQALDTQQGINDFQSEPTFTTAEDPDTGETVIVKGSIQPTKNPASDFSPTGVKTLRVAGGFVGAPAANATAAGGIIFAGAVVPTGTGVTLSFDTDAAGLGDEDQVIHRFGAGLTFGGFQGNANGYSATVVGSGLQVAVPEPTSMVMLGMGAMALLGRRRRA